MFLTLSWFVNNLHCVSNYVHIEQVVHCTQVPSPGVSRLHTQLHYMHWDVDPDSRLFFYLHKDIHRKHLLKRGTLTHKGIRWTHSSFSYISSFQFLILFIFVFYFSTLNQLGFFPKENTQTLHYGFLSLPLIFGFLFQ